MKKVFLTLALASSVMLYSCNSSGGNEQNTAEQAKANAAEMATGNEAVNNNVVEEPMTEEAADAKALVVENEAQVQNTSAAEAPVNTKPVHLTAATFKAKVFNYEKNPTTWTFEGDKPCIIDFYADWCKPCKLVAPIMDELAEKYAGQINVYKVDTQNEKELAQVFGIRSIPSVLFCPVEGKPQMTQGALPKETFEQVITDFLLADQASAQ